MRDYLSAVRRLTLALVACIPVGLLLGAIGGGLLLLLSPVVGGYWARTSSSARTSIGALFTVYLGICCIWLLLALTDGGYDWHTYAVNFYFFGTFMLPSGMIGIALASSARVRKLVHPVVERVRAELTR